jgi:hypothetical protein
VDQDQVLVLHQDLVLELQAIRTHTHTTRTIITTIHTTITTIRTTTTTTLIKIC